jgi:hypothetical protein
MCGGGGGLGQARQLVVQFSVVLVEGKKSSLAKSPLAPNAFPRFPKGELAAFFSVRAPDGQVSEAPKPEVAHRTCYIRGPIISRGKRKITHTPCRASVFCRVMHVAFLLPGRKTRNAVCPFSARAVSQSTLIKNLLGAARSKKKFELHLAAVGRVGKGKRRQRFFERQRRPASLYVSAPQLKRTPWKR